MGARRRIGAALLVFAVLCGLGSPAALAGAVYWFGQSLEPNARLAQTAREQRASPHAGNADTQGAQGFANPVGVWPALVDDSGPAS
jgi:hypothetical protein